MPRSVATMLMFEGVAEEAMRFYVSLFDDASIATIDRYGPGEAGKEGSVKHARFMLAGHTLTCIDSPVAHGFTFTPSTSLVITCKHAQEVDSLFIRLAEGGKVLMPLDDYGFGRFGWTGDRYGVSWQIGLV